MLWDGTENAGFSTAPIEKLYIPQDPDPNRITVEKSESDPNSLLNYVRSLIKLREENKTIGADADWKLLNSLENPYPMIYERTLNGNKCIVVINPSAKKVSGEIPCQEGTPEIIGGSYEKASYKSGKNFDKITVSPVSAVIYKF
jgi:maltose alpha-D-glucosyltransferase/alpha-amylase